MSTKAEPKAAPRWRITIVVEGKASDLDDALKGGMALAANRYLSLGIRSKTPDAWTAHVRTTKARKTSKP